jgi:hypothetical protein
MNEHVDDSTGRLRPLLSVYCTLDVLELDYNCKTIIPIDYCCTQRQVLNQFDPCNHDLLSIPKEHNVPLRYTNPNIEISMVDLSTCADTVHFRERRSRVF